MLIGTRPLIGRLRALALGPALALLARRHLGFVVRPLRLGAHLGLGLQTTPRRRQLIAQRRLAREFLRQALRILLATAVRCLSAGHQRRDLQLQLCHQLTGAIVSYRAVLAPIGVNLRPVNAHNTNLHKLQLLGQQQNLQETLGNLMVLNVSTRKYHRAVRLPEGDLAKARGDGTSKSAVSRRVVALSRKKMKAWLASDLSELDLLVIQIDGLHVGDHVLVAAIGVDGNGDKHVLAVVEGATENTVVVQALIDNLLARGLDPTLPRLFIVDGAKALSKAIRNTFGVAAAIQRCQVHKGRNIIERLPQHLHASVKKALRQAWDQDDADKAERLLRNLVRRLEHEEPGVSGSILEGLEEILTVIRLGLPHELRRSLACTNIVENALGTVRQVTRNVKRWRHAEMALRWTAAGLLEAQKTFRRLKAYRQLPILRNALQEHLRKAQADSAIETIMKAA